jgi:hypothetical protein
MFLKPDTLGLIQTGGYTCNNMYMNIAIMWLLHMEQTDGVAIKHARNGREYRLPELPLFNIDGHCAEKTTICEFFVCSPTQQYARVLCVPVTLCTEVDPRPCVYNLMPGKANLFII